MPNTSVPITAGVGTGIAVNVVGPLNYQVVKLDIGGDGSSTPVTLGSGNGLPVAVISTTGNVTIVPAAAQQFPIVNAPSTTISVSASAALPVSAPVGAPAFVRLSDGTNPITTLPVSGTITANQGTPIAVSSGWPVKVTDGVDTVGISTVSGAKAIKVDVIQSVGPGAVADRSTFTDGSSPVTAIAGMYNTAPVNPSSGQLAGIQITQLRGMHVNLRKNDGTELGISTAPVRTAPNGTTMQPVSGTVAANVSDNTGTAYSAANPLTVQMSGQGRTRVTNSITITVSQTGVAVWTPAGGKKFNITSIQYAFSVGGTFTLFDNTNSSANIVMDGTVPVSMGEKTFGSVPFVSAAANNVLRYTTGTGTTGVVTVHGYEV